MIFKKLRNYQNLNNHFKVLKPFKLSHINHINKVENTLKTLLRVLKKKFLMSLGIKAILKNKLHYNPFEQFKLKIPINHFLLRHYHQNFNISCN